MLAKQLADIKINNSESDDDSLPACKYGYNCIRKNPQHFREYSHPPDFEKQSVDTDTIGKHEFTYKECNMICFGLSGTSAKATPTTMTQINNTAAAMELIVITTVLRTGRDTLIHQKILRITLAVHRLCVDMERPASEPTQNI